MDSKVRNLIWQESFATGGATTFVDRIVQFSLDQGYETFLLCSKRQEKRYARSGVQVILSERLAFVKLPNGTLRKVFYLVKELIALSKVVKAVKPDIITVSNVAEGTQLGALFFNIPLIYFIHTCPRGRLGFIMSVYFRLFKKNRHVIATVSNYSARKVEHYFNITHGDVRTIYNYAESVDSEVLVTNKQFVTVFTAGHVTSYKNPELWLQIANELISKYSNVQFVWAGTGELIDEMNRKVTNSSYKEKIRFIGHQNDLTGYYRNADIYFQPSSIESHGIAVVEAMSHGLPCVVSDIGGLPESVLHNFTGYVVSFDKKELFVESISCLVEGIELRKDMGANGQERASELFSKEKWQKEVHSLYKELIG